MSESEVLRPKLLKVLFSKSGAPKWVTESGPDGENTGMYVVVKRGQTVQWRRKDDQKFTIRFVSPATRTPFSNWDQQFKESSGGNPNVVTGAVSGSEDLDVVYKYNVEAAGHDALDPAIIIDE